MNAFVSYSVILSRFVSKARDSFVLRNNFPCVISNAQKLLWLRMKLLRSFVHRCSDVISVGVQTGRIGWPFLLLNPMQIVLCSLMSNMLCVQSPVHLRQSAVLSVCLFCLLLFPMNFGSRTFITVFKNITTKITLQWRHCCIKHKWELINWN